MSGPLPAQGYISNPSRTVQEAQNEWELDVAVAKETLGGAPESTVLSISSNTITPPNNACVLPVDQSGGGTINTIQVTNLRNGQVIFIHSISSSNPITIANNASGTGAKIATFGGQNIVLTNPAMFIALKYNASLGVSPGTFQEIFPYPVWGAPGAIGATTPNTGAFTSISLSTALTIANGGTGQTTAAAAFNALSPITTLGDLIYGSSANTAARLPGNTSSAKQFLTQTGTGSVSAAPQWSGIAAGDLPSSVVLNNASNTYSGSNTQDFSASTQILRLPTKGDPAGPTTSEVWLSGSTGTVLKFRDNASTPATHTVADNTCNVNAGTGLTGGGAIKGSQTISLATPVAVANGGTGASTVSSGTLFGNFTGSNAAPSFNSAGSPDQILGVAHSGGGLEYKTIQAAVGSGITVTAGAGTITIGSSGGSGSVTSVAMTGDGTIFNSTVSGSPITSSGTLAPSLKTQSALTILGGPNVPGASASAPTFTNFDDVATMNGASGIRPLLCSVPAAPTVTQGGTAGSTHYSYDIVGVMADGTDYTAA